MAPPEAPGPPEAPAKFPVKTLFETVSEKLLSLSASVIVMAPPFCSPELLMKEEFSTNRFAPRAVIAPTTVPTGLLRATPTLFSKVLFRIVSDVGTPEMPRISTTVLPPKLLVKEELSMKASESKN